MEDTGPFWQGTPSLLYSEYGAITLVLEHVAAWIDIIAMLIMLVGVIRFLWGFVRSETKLASPLRARIVNEQRIDLARYILAGLTVFIVSDIMHTALSLDLGDLLFLGLLVAIRAAVSHSLGREVLQIKENPEL
ncbi:putative membrane protein [Aliiruegeria haliotis]|uniref:Putative membrane protein n=1 Tax=Aliiruegeria haliotis TaxID=1280846 RepID=A0A2T0RZ66_9RHOB|nr:DUF1622 domain-containing protein [Aliiruegeria haliotis]PRY26476.1 putative membrane protein [Aliiruegeria haliotis]